MQGIQSINIPLHSKWVQTGQWQKSPETVVTASTDSDYPQFSDAFLFRFKMRHCLNGSGFV
jgi:hypothetical protein